MTKFESEAIGSRGKGYKSYTMKERKKDLEEFQKTGKHPEIEQVQERQARDLLRALPEPDAGRPRTYLQFSIGKEVVGKVVFEVFQDMVPLPARAFVNRCRQGSTSTLQHTVVHRALPNLGLFLGNNSKYKGETVRLKGLSSLRHVDPQTVSITPDGTEIVISLGRSLTLDASHLVVGRVQLGEEVLQQILAVGQDSHDAPLQQVSISGCGMTNNKGVVEVDAAADAAAARRSETPEQTAARLKEESKAAAASMRDALQAGLKRKEPDAAPQPAEVAAKLPRSHYDVLGDLSSSDSSDASGPDD